jgi:hypothetical protein
MPLVTLPYWIIKIPRPNNSVKLDSSQDVLFFASKSWLANVLKEKEKTLSRCSERITKSRKR